jgi:hypothetical protein
MTSIDSGVFSGSRAFGLATALVVVAACSSSSNNNGSGSTQPPAVTCASPGGPSAPPGGTAPPDHCIVNGVPIKQATDQASCFPEAGAAGDDGGQGTGDDAGQGDDTSGDDASGPGDGGPTGDCDPSEFGAAMYGNSGDDDDCKYDVKWSSTPICEGGNGVYFTVSAVNRVDGTPLTGATPYIEAVQACLHAVPNPPPPAVTSTEETSPVTYKIGPIVFDRPGGWVVRFHFFGSCEDTLETSPHGHAAFFVTVP